MNGKEMQIGSFGGPSRGGGGGGKNSSPVIATLPRHVKSWLMMLVISNSACWLAFGFDWLGFEGEVSVLKAAISGGAILWCVVAIPIQVVFISKTDWGQKGSGG